MFDDSRMPVALPGTVRFSPMVRGFAEFNGLAFRFRALSGSCDLLVPDRGTSISGQDEYDGEAAD
jgi:hypothetical protein